MSEKVKKKITEEDVERAKQGDPVSLAKYHRFRGGEYGTTTGRPRRVGHQDLVAAGYSRDVSNVAKGLGAMSVVLTKLDVSDGLPSLKVCTHYKQDGTLSERFPRDSSLGEVEPVYEELEGWNENTRGLTSYNQLPSAAQRFVRFLKTRLGMSVSLISTGPRRKEIIDRSDEVYL